MKVGETQPLNLSTMSMDGVLGVLTATILPATTQSVSSQTLALC
nr:MAG TPA: hypothetical protein [Caudoviricetes sp.]